MLKLDGVSCGYGNVQVLWDISLDVRDREIVTIIGPNGAGKTTILNAIYGLLPLLKGDVLFRSESASGGLHPRNLSTWGSATPLRGERFLPPCP